jgi:hypothetical protein
VALKVSERFRVAVEPAMLVGYRRHPHGMSAGIDRMWRSYTLVLESARVRRGRTSDAAIRRAEDQFALYLAGVSFWSREYRRALGWGVRALRSSVSYRILPHIVSGLAPMLWRGTSPQRKVITPGTRFGEWEIPEPRIPYERIYRGLLPLSR